MLCAVCTTASALTRVFNVKVLLPVLEVRVNPEIDKILTHKLANDDIVNLALGRPSIPSSTRRPRCSLPLRAFETEGEHRMSQLVVYDTTKSGEDGIVAVVGAMDMLEWQSAYLSKDKDGFGLSRGKINATTHGTLPPKTASRSRLSGGWQMLGKYLVPLEEADAAPKGVVMIQGHVKYVYTDRQGTHTVDGFVTNGLGKISGKPIGGWDD